MRGETKIKDTSQSAFCIDSTFTAAHDLVGKSDLEVREAIGDKFPKHIYHSIVCIGALVARQRPDQAFSHRRELATGERIGP
jgi:hypothetical protein